MLSFRTSLGKQPARKAAHCLLILSVAFMGLTPPACRADTKDAQVATLQLQVNALDLKISQADRELAAVGEPNWGCGCGAMVLLAVIPGAILWYFADVKPKEDKKREIQARIDRLQQEKQNLQNQIMLLQSSR